MVRSAQPLEPGDFDLAEKDEAGLLAEVVTLTAYLERASTWRTRRVRAFRALRDLKVQRGVIAEAAGGITPGAIGNLIGDLDRAEQAWNDQVDRDAAAAAASQNHHEPDAEEA